MMKKQSVAAPVTPGEALVKLQRFCAFRERSIQEVTTKLSQWGIDSKEREGIVTRLREQGFLNEQRFSASFAGGKFRTRKWGRVKIRAMLAGAKVSEGAIKAALDQIPDADYRRELEKLMIKKLASIHEADLFKRKQKLARFALGKGYEADLVWELAGKMVPDA
jgi:regulatory protein